MQNAKRKTSKAIPAKRIRFIKTALTHLTIVCSLAFLTFLVLDYYNPRMNFVGNSLSRKLLAGFCLLSVINGVWQTVEKRKA